MFNSNCLLKQRLIIFSVFFALAVSAAVFGADSFSAPIFDYTAIGKYEETDYQYFKAARFDKTAESLQDQYQDALKDAEIAEPGEISKNLNPIVSYNSKLLTDYTNGTKRVLFTTWTSYTGYDSLVGTTTTLTREVWVTVVPEIKEFTTAHNVSETSLTLRLEQLLGIPPNIGKTRFVEMWAEPKDLFRPAPDPEITDCEAELDFAEPSDLIVTADSHKKWINDLKATSYLPNGYPWTRLGYTYDWGNSPDNIGLSEYVIRKGAIVKIKASTLTADYALPIKNKNLQWIYY